MNTHPAAVTPTMRFALVDLREAMRRANGYGSLTARALTLAHYWEGCPNGYKPAQVEAAVALIHAVGAWAQDGRTAEGLDAIAPHVDLVLALA